MFETRLKDCAERKKKKHVCHWQGPYVVVERLSSSTYAIESLDKNKRFERNISHLRTVSEQVEISDSAVESRVASQEELPRNVGNFYLACEPNQACCSICQIVKVHETRGYEVVIYGSYRGDIRDKMCKIHTKRIYLEGWDPDKSQWLYIVMRREPSHSCIT